MVKHEHDLALVVAALRGQRAAVEELTVRLFAIPRILAILDRRRGGRLDAHDLEDLGQDLLVTIWERLDRFEGRGSLESWIHGFCMRGYLGSLRRRKPMPITEESTPEVPLTDTERLELLLEELGPPCAEIIHLHDYEDSSFSEIGKAMGMPLGTVKTHYYKGIRWLRRRLSGTYEEVRP